MTVPGPVLRLQARRHSRRTCRDELLDAAERLRQRSGQDTFARRELLSEVFSSDVGYERQSVYKTMRRMTGQEADAGPPDFEQVGNGRLRVIANAKR